MRNDILIAGLALTAAAGPLFALQVPIGPPQSSHGCLRPDVAKNTQLVKDAIANKSAADPVEVLRPVAGCTYYQVTLVSKMTIEDTEVAGVTSTISGKGTITFGLAPDNAMAGYDFTSGVQDLTAPIYWDRGSALITRPNCIVTTVELPHTLFAFWLGVTSSQTPKVGVRISPADQDLHSIATRCKDPVGKWHDLPPGKEAIFAPAWIKLHGEGKSKVAPSADQQAITQFTDDMVKAGPKPGSKIKPNKAYSTPAAPTLSSPTGAMDLGKLQAMQDYMKKNPNATPAEMMKQMEGVVPNLDQQLAAAEDNFMFTAPGDCAAVNATKTVCTLSGPPVTTDRLGYGTVKRITERTTITIEKVAPPPGSP